MVCKQVFLIFLAITFLHCTSNVPDDVLAEVQYLQSEIDYNFDVKPILADRCFSCHGPDEVAREADLRLDLGDDAKKKRANGQYAIRPGSWKKSELVNRILSSDSEYQMPPTESKLHLTTKEKAILLAWIDQGAEYLEHWSFSTPDKPDVPQITDASTANTIDQFVLAKLQGKGLDPSPRAGKERLLKRVFMDLTGLPPSIDQIDAFLSDQSANAWEKVVDQLLESEACAERLTMEWLDLARYADSHGLHADGWRRMWPWRDWVIDAFNKNMPYDRFVTEQLAGDLLPNPTRDQIIATAFHRNHPMTAEGGAIDEEFRMEYVADRTNTTATALMGLTLECARCHDHKFDPISQKEYYQMTAFFNNVHELGMTGDDGNYGPLLQLASEKTTSLLADLDNKIESVNAEIIEQESAIQELRAFVNTNIVNTDDALIGHYPMEDVGKKQINNRQTTIIDNNRNCTSNGLPNLVDGKIGNALDFVNEYDELYVHDIGGFDVHDEFSVAIWVNTRKKKREKTQVLVGNAGDKNNYWRGWDFYLDDRNRLNFRLIHSLPHNYLHFYSRDSISLNSWTHLAVSYDGSGALSNSQLFIDGEAVSVDIAYNKLYKNIRTVSSGANEEIDRPLRIGKSYRAFTGDNGIFQGFMDELRIYAKPLSEWEVSKLALRERTQIGDQKKMQHAQINDKNLKELRTRRSDLIEQKIAMTDTVPEIMVMEEMATPRPAYVLDRGQYNAHKEVVQVGTPESILSFSDDLPRNRLGLAQWLFHPDHPLTARATVNRYWQMIFGRGIVKSARDFGSQGSLPSHPELLDWLAIYFRDSGWNLKSLLKKMVMSDTYQQSSIASKEHAERDPENIFLARGASYRWPGEMIRDNALAASGLLVRRIGGPSVKPYQPKGLWIEKGTFSHRLLRYEESEGDDLYRRSLYTFIKRTSPHPVMSVFDAPTRDVCTVTRESTNTPLQALVLLNDPQFVEAARVLATRVLKEADSLEDQIGNAFRLVTGRVAKKDEISVLKNTFERYREKFNGDQEDRRNLLSVGASENDNTLDETDMAAMTMVASTLINHDESYMKR